MISPSRTRFWFLENKIENWLQGTCFSIFSNMIGQCHENILQTTCFADLNCCCGYTIDKPWSYEYFWSWKYLSWGEKKKGMAKFSWVVDWSWKIRPKDKFSPTREELMQDNILVYLDLLCLIILLPYWLLS